METAGGALAGDIPGFLDDVDADYLRVYNRVSLGHRLTHPHGLTLLLPSEEDRKKLVKEYDSARTASDGCALKNKLLGLIIPAPVGEKEWAQLAKAGHYINAAGNKIAITGVGKIIKLEGGVEAELSKAATFFRCNREGVTDSVYFVYNINKMPPVGAPTDENLGSMLRKDATGGTDRTEVEAWWCKVMRDYAKLMADGKSQDAHNYIARIIVNWMTTVKDEVQKGKLSSTNLCNLILADLSNQTGLCVLLWYIVSLDGGPQMETKDLERLAADMVSTGSEQDMIKNMAQMRINVMCAESVGSEARGEEQKRATARYEKMQAINNEMKAALSKCESVVAAYEKIILKLREFVAALSNRAAEKINGPALDRIFYSILIGNDLQNVAVNANEWKHFGDSVFVRALASFPANLTGPPTWLMTHDSMQLGVGNDTLAYLRGFSMDHLIGNVPPNLTTTGGSSAVPASLASAVRAWSAFGGGDVDALVAVVRDGSA